ncbi:unnamed protein product [Protopolystoma xenopodis]|uniref:Uncharacterized protein n=1 Tax=Protopolystoma xenopodis TaxID=117903 RepID=A0A3S4ZTS9_9PLAT|nr:unnamed protein product [Protopolystoma xenopodis]
MPPARSRHYSKTIAALTARQYRNNKKLELERLRNGLHLALMEVERFRSLYLAAQLELTEMCQRYESLRTRHHNPLSDGSVHGSLGESSTLCSPDLDPFYDDINHPPVSPSDPVLTEVI